MQIHDNQNAHRLEVEIDGHKAWLDYTLEGKNLIIRHTDVPDEVGGRGVGSALVRHARDMAQEAGLNVVSHCSFATTWLQKHP